MTFSQYTFIISYLHKKRRDGCCVEKEEGARDKEEKRKKEIHEKKRLKQEKEKLTEECLTQEAKVFN